MTEQEKTSAVVEETREAVDTTSQPVATEKKSKNNTALILSAVAIAIALAAGIGLPHGSEIKAILRPRHEARAELVLQ